MGLLRSEQMKHGTLVLPAERARHFIDLVGANVNMQFEDMNSHNMQRPYKKYTQRLDEMERIIRFLTDELARIPEAEIKTNNVEGFLTNEGVYKLDDVEARLREIYQTFVQCKDNNARLLERRNAALEERFVVQTATASLRQVSSSMQRGRESDEGDQFEYDASRSLLSDTEDRPSASATRSIEMMFSNIGGVIPQAEQDRFARTLFRATRGNTFTHFQQIFEPMQDPKTGRDVHKSVFVVYFQDSRLGGSASAMSDRIAKICNSFGVNTYSWPNSFEEAEQRRAKLGVQVEDQHRLLRAHESFVMSEAEALLEPPRRGANSIIEEWRLFCKKEKSIYATLNLFEGHMNLRANAWYPAEEEDHVRAMLIRQSNGQNGQSSAMLVSDRVPPSGHKKNPPTYVRVNEFTSCFQELIDTYGLPRYEEANPTLFAIVTFPFLFGIMYGDVGHGSMLFLAGLWLVWNPEQVKYAAPALHSGRYIITMMGFFGIYAGLMYNDFFSVGFDFFGSRWNAIAHTDGDAGAEQFEPAFDAKNEGGLGPYPFGLDPAWHGATNELIYLNSMKMKISVIIGVVQMTTGLFLRWSNAFFTGNGVDFCCECIPMMVFMMCFFGYMDFMILYKWVTPLQNPPSIINSLICMGMGQKDNALMWDASIPGTLMIACVMTVPWMLFPKPILMLMKHRAENSGPGSGVHGNGAGGYGRAVPLGYDEDPEMSGKTDEEEPFDFGEICIHQVIETIEYVLGTVSHTASYLRLWALSLAHQQLSLVFFGYTISSAMQSSFPFNAIAIYIMFAAWFGVTVGVLLGMDVLECFLHTLRLHWVEFQSKFYKADGYRFEPYRHQALLEQKD